MTYAVNANKIWKVNILPDDPGDKPGKDWTLIKFLEDDYEAWIPSRCLFKTEVEAKKLLTKKS